jgi:23S rRNA (guanosine2251-2'-O)-methyltransferase
MWIFGFHPVREALRHRPRQVRQVRLHRGRSDGRRVEIEALCATHDVPCREVEPAELEVHADGPHNGFVAEVDALDVAAADPAAEDSGADEIIVLVEDLQDPRNFGALLRVCDAAGVSRVLIRDRGSTALTPVAVKTSAGAAESLPMERITNSALEMERLKKRGYWIYGAAEEGVPPWQLDLSGRVLLCIGGESKGLRRRTRETCDALVGLPMAGRVESLNLATAAAAILFEIVRQQASRDR